MTASFPLPPSPASPPDVAAEKSRTGVRPAGPVARWVIAGSVAVSSAFLAGYLYFVDPNVASNTYPQCPLKALTGIDCPGCGGLRATHSLVHGDLRGAIDHNIIAVVLVPMMAYMLLRWTLGQFGKELPAIPWPRWTSWALPLGLVLFTIVRNIPGTPLYYFNSATAT